ncbi:MAG: glycosyltransferase family 2 protein, partial [Clostridia bacterium]|nr:glycosyltransferase family 2 protein [Clostridia bacterium]
MNKVSIIVPCRDGETYLAACIESVLRQTFTDFELLLIDDGSKDGSLSIMQSFAADDARIRILAGPGAGVGRARNLGLSEARGEWIFFMDADDILPADALRTLAKKADDPSVDMVIGAHETFGEHQETVLFWPETRWYRLPWPERQRAMALRLIEGDSILNIMCNKLHRRGFLDHAGIHLSDHVRVAEDALFNLEAVLLSHGCVYCHAVTYRYRMHAASTMNRAEGSAFDLHRPWLLEMREMLRRRGQLEQYYGAFVDSVMLRLYKDSGIAGAVRDFDSKALPLVNPDGLERSQMSVRDRRTAEMIEKGRYPSGYPFVAAGQILRRKAGEASFALRR